MREVRVKPSDTHATAIIAVTFNDIETILDALQAVEEAAMDPRVHDPDWDMSFLRVRFESVRLRMDGRHVRERDPSHD